MGINFFRPSERGSRTMDENAFKVLFTEKPKGLRFNALMARRLSSHKVRYVQVGMMDDTLLIIKPSYDKEGAFAVAGNPSSMQVSAADLFYWAEDKGLIGKRVTGSWNNDEGHYEFDVTQAMDDTGDDE